MQHHQAWFTAEVLLEGLTLLQSQYEKRLQQPLLEGQAFQQIRKKVEDLRFSNDQLESQLSAQSDGAERNWWQQISKNPTSEELEQIEIEVISTRSHKRPYVVSNSCRFEDE